MEGKLVSLGLPFRREVVPELGEVSESILESGPTSTDVLHSILHPGEAIEPVDITAVVI